MRIVVDRDFTADGVVIAEHVIDTAGVANIFHPVKAGVLITPLEMVAMLAADTNLRDRTGWNVASQHPYESKPATRWQRLMSQAATVGADIDLTTVLYPQGIPNEQTVLDNAVTE